MQLGADELQPITLSTPLLPLPEPPLEEVIVQANPWTWQAAVLALAGLWVIGNVAGKR